ncbi:MAG: site-specific integrase [Propionibacteriaceae bacterium]|nr:site-specific integrase [Propionibacteriaceae bacterium]
MVRYTVNGKRFQEMHPTKRLAEEALNRIQTDVSRGVWKSPAEVKAEAAARANAHTVETWSRVYLLMPGKRGPRKPRTTEDYEGYLRRFVIPAFGDMLLTDITREQVTLWASNLCPNRPSQRANVYTFFAGLMMAAARQGLIPFTPCVVPGASTKHRQGRTILPSGNDVILASGLMPSGYELMPLIAGWCGLREGEVIGLTRGAIDIEARLIHVYQAAEFYDKKAHAGTPKSHTARSVPIRAEWLVERLIKHMATLPNRPDMLLFPPPRSGALLNRYTMIEWWNNAKAAIGITDVRFHDLRGLYASMRAEMGATSWEIMEEMGQKSIGVLALYINRTPERAQKIKEQQLPIPSILALDS